MLDWSTLLGHEKQKEWFSTALQRGRLATSFLFAGPDGIGKRTFARMLAKCLLCRNTAADDLNCCNQCEDCAQVEASTHPDLIQVSKPEEKAYLPIELLIGEREKRMREGLCHDISLKPWGGRRKIAILDDADYLNVEGANSLLKTLEEPPINSMLILVGTSLQRQLPTIRSRCQSIVFRKLSKESLSQLIQVNELADSKEPADRLADNSKGSLTQAARLADPELQQFFADLLPMLVTPHIEIVELAKQIGASVDSVGKEGRLKRERLKLIFQFAADFYRNIAVPVEGTQIRQPAFLAEAESRWRQLPQNGSALALRNWNRCLRAIEEVDRNANQASLLAAWSADISLA